MKSGHLLRTAFLGAALGAAAFGVAQAAEPPLKIGLLEDAFSDGRSSSSISIRRAITPGIRSLRDGFSAATRSTC
jgi:hypothetical protein